MAEEKQSASGSSIFVVVAAVVSAAYFAWQKPSLEGFRPAETAHQAHDNKGRQDVEARLWQDPLVAIQEQKTATTTREDHSIQTVREYFNKSLVIGVTVPGGPYPEDSETRRRLRYAVLAALHTAHYVPVDETHLGYFLTGENEPRDGVAQHNVAVTGAGPVRPASDNQKNLEPPPLPTLIPFEQFKNQETGGQQISILWLNEGGLAAAHRPIESIKWLQCQLHLSNARFPVLGPQQSTTLMDMLNEVTKPNNEHQKCRSDKTLPIYNFGATADEYILLGGSGYSENDVEDALRIGNIDYYRTIDTDGELAKVLAPELKRRLDGLSAAPAKLSNDNSDHIVLVFEADTVYGRSLRHTIASELMHGAVLQLPLESFSYFRGLDGLVPKTRSLEKITSSGEGAGGSTSGRRPTDAEKGEPGQDEVASGQGQLDYLRRLADHLQELDNKTRLKGSGKIAAVGILGSDVYDKHLLLEAIRPELPEALFFTTDLDALLLPHGKFRFTRNLIVASSYGLELTGELQADIAPFRNVYQSSIFLATRIAIVNELANSANTDSTFSQKTKRALKCWLPRENSRAQLFQIGRSQVQSLPTGNESLPKNCEQPGRHQDFLDYLSIVPIAKPLFPEIRPASIIPVGFLGAILLGTVLMTSEQLRKRCFPRDKSTNSWYAPVRPRYGAVFILLGVVLLIGLGLSAYWPFFADMLTEHGIGEPMSLLEGISIWPTVLLRAASCVLGIWLIFYTLQCLETDLKCRRKEMNLPKLCLQLWEGQSLVARWYEMASLLWCRPALDDDDKGDPKSTNSEPPHNRVTGSGIEMEKARQMRPFRKLWMTYSYYARPRWRLTRAAIGVLVMMVLWWFILAKIFGEPNAPARGLVAYYIYIWVTLVDVLITLFLIFLVVDATLFSRSVVIHLTRMESHWPGETVERYHLGRANLEDWLDIKFVAERTRCITRLIYFPFLMLALLIVSRSPIFDNYSFTPTLVIEQGILLAIIIGSVVSLRNAAEQARKTAMEHLSEKIMAAGHADPNRAIQLEKLRTEVRDMQDGAFAPPLSQPVVKAVLLPLVSYGGTWLVQLYALPGL
jgi:hypothetical protein